MKINKLLNFLGITIATIPVTLLVSCNDPRTPEEKQFDTAFTNFRKKFMDNFATNKTYNSFYVRTTGDYPDYWTIRGTGSGNYYASGTIVLDEEHKGYTYWPVDETGYSPVGISNELYLYEKVTDFKNAIQDEIKKYNCTVKYSATSGQMSYKYVNSEGEVVHITTYNSEGHLIEYYDIIREGALENRNVYFHPSNFHKKI